MEQIDLLRHAVEALERMSVPYVVVGSFASIACGESRFTQDIDIVAAFQWRVTGDGVNRAEVERWASKLGYLEIWQQIVAKVNAPDAPPGPRTP